MSNETESLSAILASARESLEDDSWIDEITAPDEDGQPNDYARRVVCLDDALAALDRIEAAEGRERTIERDRLGGLVARLADNLARYHLVGERERALLREARAAVGEDAR